jgi:hypothetical protein
MADPKFDYETAAKALADAKFAGDRRACEKHGVAERTLRGYRKRLDSDPELARLYQHFLGLETASMQAKRARGELRWRLETQKALASIARRVADLSVTCENIDLLSKAFARMGEPEYTSELLNAGDASTNRVQAEADKEPARSEERQSPDEPEAPTIQ